MNEDEANSTYQKYLEKYVIPLVGNVTTDIDQIDEAGRILLRYKYKGTFASDKIPKLNDLKPYCILNLDKTGQPGSHWVAVAKIPNKDKCLIYDSFGRSYKQIIPDIQTSGNGSIVDTDRDAEQAYIETNCGARCLAFLLLFDIHGYKVAKLI